MTFRTAILAALQQEELNFLLTNRVPRRVLTRVVGRVSAIEQPVVRDLSLALFRWFADVDLSDAAEQRFASLRDCFIRELRPGARPVAMDEAVLVSPCDAIVGACGAVKGTEVLQAKGFPYGIEELLGDPDLVRAFRDGTYVTLRLRAGMYHRFHAPHDCRIEEVRYVSGDTWNVNPIALRRIDRLFCKNERAVLRARLAGGQLIALVPVASILVASIRLHFLDVLLHLRYRGPQVIACDAPFRKGEELGWFEHGSTVIVFAPPGCELSAGVGEGSRIRVGEPLLQLK